MNMLFIEWQHAKERGNQREFDILNQKSKDMISNTSFYLFEFFYPAWNQSEISQGISVNFNSRAEFVSQVDSQGHWETFFEFLGQLDMQPYWNTFTFTDEDLLWRSFEMVTEGMEHSTKNDVYGFTTVLYAIVLFLLGISNSFKEIRYKKILVVISCAVFSFAFLIMLAIPYM